MCPDRSCSAASLLHFQLLLYNKHTQPTVMTEITHGRQGPAFYVDSSLVLGVKRFDISNKSNASHTVREPD